MLEFCGSCRGMTCLDWTELKQRYRNATIITVPIDAPEGVLGALTGAAGPEKPEEELVLELQTLAQQLAHSLTFCKCKNDLQVCLADLNSDASLCLPVNCMLTTAVLAM
jgi:hypothetical protein